jgi:hypothetical protein
MGGKVNFTFAPNKLLLKSHYDEAIVVCDLLILFRYIPWDIVFCQHHNHM